jgi:hypothetical protein
MSDLSTFEFEVITLDELGKECDRTLNSSQYRVEALEDV